MRKFFGIIFLLTVFISVYAHAAVIRLDLKKDFGARGDGKSDDSKAWSEAINYVSNKTPDGSMNLQNVNYDKDEVVLFIPKGTYRIGRQEISSSKKPLKNHASPLYSTLIWNIKGKGLTIIGETDEKGRILSKFKLLDGLKYGYFDNISGQGTSQNSSKNHAVIGSIISIAWNCENITIKNLEFDGNVDKVIYQKISSGRGTDIIYTGIGTSTVRGLKLENLYLHHFGLDGLTIQAHREPTSQYGGYNVRIKDVVSEYNGRQALTFGVGTGLLVENSVFRYSGQIRFAIPPSANVDIENHDKSGKPLSNIIFNHCIIEGNSGGSGSLNLAGKLKDITFNNCKIHASDKSIYAIQSNFSPSRTFTFNDCDIKGNIIMYNAAKIMDKDGQTVFSNCTFSDNNNFNTHSADKPMLWLHDKVLFKNCTFYLNPNRQFIKAQPDQTKSFASQSVIFQNSKILDSISQKTIHSGALKDIHSKYIIIK